MTDNNNEPQQKESTDSTEKRKGLSAEDWVMVAGLTTIVIFLWLIAFIFVIRRSGPIAFPQAIVEIAATSGFTLPPTWTPGPTEEFIPTAVATQAYDGLAPTRMYTPRATSLPGLPALLLPNRVYPNDINIIDLARIMQGESTGDQEAAYYVGWVAKNRLLHESYGDTYAVVSSGFFGYKASLTPNDDFIDIAMRITTAKVDPTDGCLYALSRTDITNLGVPPQRADVTNGEWFFFRTWPLSGR